MDTKELLKKVRKIEIKTRRLSNDVFGGEYHSAFKGRGMTFSEVRKYTYGDDVRAIDWNVTARFREPFVKIFEEERELTLMLVADVSGSEHFGTENQIKKEILTEIAATLAFSAMQNNDKVGLLLFSDQVELFVPPKKSRSHVLRIIRELLEFRPHSQGTDLNIAIEYLLGVLKKKAIVFILSDFLSADYEHSLRIIGRKHDVTGIRIYDKGDEAIPDLGVISLIDRETGNPIIVDTTSRSIRKRFEVNYRERADYFKKSFSHSRSGALNVRTDQNYITTLLGYFKHRA